MNRSPLTLAGAAIVIAGALAALAGCAGGAPAPSSTPTTTTGSAPPVPSSTTSAQPTAQADPACDTIIPGDVVTSFQDAGWSFEEEVFRLGATEISGGITCTWGDPKVAGDNVQMFGWAPIGADDAARAQTALGQEGWVREEDAAGVYITENPDAASSTDEDGYGWTYLFGDGWVKFADTKQGLLLVDWPPAG